MRQSLRERSLSKSLTASFTISSMFKDPSWFLGIVVEGALWYICGMTCCWINEPTRGDAILNLVHVSNGSGCKISSQEWSWLTVVLEGDFHIAPKTPKEWKSKEINPQQLDASPAQGYRPILRTWDIPRFDANLWQQHFATAWNWEFLLLSQEVKFSFCHPCYSMQRSTAQLPPSGSGSGSGIVLRLLYPIVEAAKYHDRVGSTIRYPIVRGHWIVLSMGAGS